jgi:hypothetical protein
MSTRWWVLPRDFFLVLLRLRPPSDAAYLSLLEKNWVSFVLHLFVCKDRIKAHTPQDKKGRSKAPNVVGFY